MTAASPVPADLDQLVAALGGIASITTAERGGAMAEFLSGSEGWRDARAALRGAFAEAPKASAERSGTKPQLTPGQDK